MNATTANANQPIYVTLSHGMGNQMFQYAAGRAAALRADTDVVMDLRFFDQFPKIKYGLTPFPIEARIGEYSELPPLKSEGLRYRLWKMGTAFSGKRLIETRNGFTDRAMKAKPGSQFKGYWQNEQYFADKAPQLRQELRVKYNPTGQNAAMLADIQNTELTVSVHIRRADYVKLSDYFVALQPAFYAETGARIAAMLGKTPNFYVFSDAPDWASENIELPGPTIFVRHNDGATAHEDMRLMSHCDHHIIANSTFSWWGAWLNPSPDKIVIAPKTWYMGDWLSSDFIVPDSWIRHPVPGLENAQQQSLKVQDL